MKANELADKLEQGHWEGGTREQAATMLRQQQAEIEELKTCLIVEQEHNELMVEDRSKYEALAHAGGVEVGKELKTLTDEEDTECQYCKQSCIRCDARKLLTDEEILDIWYAMKDDSNNWTRYVDFARAILRKAQEADKIESLGTVNIGGVHYRNGKPEK